MRRERSRLPFLLLSCFCLVWATAHSIDGLASSFKECLETYLYWQPLAKRLDSSVDVSHYDSAAIALSGGRSYSWNSLAREGGDADSSSAAFLAASFEWETFIPKFQARLKELSRGDAELIAISAEEAGVESSRSDARYFKLIRRMPRGKNEKIVALTRDGIRVQSKSEVGAAKAKTPGKRRVDPRSIARAARRSGGAPIAKGISSDYAKASAEDAQLFWAPFLKRLENTPEVDARHFDAAVSAVDYGKSYSTSTLKEQNQEDEGARKTFHRISTEWEDFVPRFQARLKQISKGKTELIPISANEAGLAVSGYGLFFKLIRQTYRGPQEDIVWLTSEGFDVLAKPKSTR